MRPDEKESLRTGIETIDRELKDGIPNGTVAVLSANPASQSELFLYELTAARESVYLSTVRTADSVRDVFESREIDSDSNEVIRLDDEDPLTHGRRILSDLSDGVTLIVDPMDPLERKEAGEYRRFLAEMNDRVSGTAIVAVLHCLRHETTLAHRRETLHLADMVFDLQTEVRGDSIVNKLSIPKFRQGQSMEEVIKLDLTSEVEVDMSRNLL